MTPEQFWESSPRELFRAFEAARLRRRDEHDRDVSLAWTGIMLYAKALAKKLPALNTLLFSRRKATAPQSLRGSREAMLAFATRHNRARKRKGKKAKD